MASPSFKLVDATPSDTADMATCYFEAFVDMPHPQAQFYGQMFPNRPSVHEFFAKSLSEQMRREPQAAFLKVVDANANDKLVGFIKWTAPRSGESYWADCAVDSDASLCDAFFGAMAENRNRLMAERPHWYVELMGVSSQYARKGAGSMLIDYGCKLADRDNVEAYVDASPVARPLYERYQFEVKNTTTMPSPFDWYVESFMVRSPNKRRRRLEQCIGCRSI